MTEKNHFAQQMLYTKFFIWPWFVHLQNIYLFVNSNSLTELFTLHIISVGYFVQTYKWKSVNFCFFLIFLSGSNYNTNNINTTLSSTRGEHVHNYMYYNENMHYISFIMDDLELFFFVLIILKHLNQPLFAKIKTLMTCFGLHPLSYKEHFTPLQIFLKITFFGGKNNVN